MTAKTIDDRLRAQAAEALHKEVNSATLPLMNLVRESEWPRGKFGAEQNMPLHEAIGVIEKALQAALTDKRTNAAIEVFMKRVNSLQEQLDELRDISHEH